MSDSPDPTALRALCSVAEHGSLTRASAALGVAQSVLSRRIAALERDLGVPLFHRNGRGVVATDAAARLLPRARAILAETSALIEDARGERASPSGIVEIGLVPVVARPLVSALVQRLRRDYPRIRLRVTEGYSGQVEEWLGAGRVDLGLFNRYGRGGVRGAEAYLTSGIVLVTRREGSPIRGATVPFRALEGLPLVMPLRPNPLVSAASDLAMRQRFVLDIVLEAGSAAIVRDAVLGAGLATLVPENLARREYPKEAFVTARVVRPALTQKTWLAFTTQRPAGLAVRAVGRLVREMAAGLGRE
jgi:DNA-binding transcriptional LysR family regulator